jgi:predicted O-linked N-acetylglucosamine transferase (SPINDLY family)
MAPEAAGAFQRALAAYQRQQWEEARSECHRTLELAPTHVDALNLLGILAMQSNDPASAARAFARAAAADPHNPEPWHHLGVALLTMGRHAEAIASFDQVLAVDAGCVDAHNNRALACLGQGDAAAALASLDRAIELEPLRADLLFNRGNTLQALRRHTAAIVDYDAALARRPAWADAHVNRGTALFELGRHEAALASVDAALSIDAAHRMALANRAIVLRSLRRYAEAVESFDRAIALALAAGGRAAGGVGPLQGMRLHAKLQICDWSNHDADLAALLAAVERREVATTPLCMLALSGSARLQRLAAESWVRSQGWSATAPAAAPAAPTATAGRSKIRLGYFSADFREHPVAALLAEVIELHDRSRFEVIAFSFGPRTDDGLQRRLMAAFDSFIDVRAHTDRDIAALARSTGLDIAIDLGGFTEASRPAIFAQRAAPIQISYLGYLGTLGTDHMDYLIADETLIPPDNRLHYAEKIIYLPSYQANDSKRLVSDRLFTRADLGLPADGCVFCCFNANYKITPSVFAGWMRILERTDGSVLFLYSGHALAQANLTEAAIRHGIDPARLVFGGGLAGADYRARFRCADLFLDTLPYNAGTTASDALWVGLPVLTCAGEAFASRMAASLLQALELPELIADNPVEYERRAVDLAQNPAHLSALKQKLASKLRSAPLFDSIRFTRHLESAYGALHARHAAALPPEHLHVAAD